MNTNTIAAISTAPGAAGIAVIRISGTDAFAIADRVIRCGGEPPSRRPGNTFVHGVIHAGTDVDDVVVLIYRAPHSYTCEDVVEIQGHGGRACAQRVLRTVLNAGARPAEAGEFTKRAFLNGRLDLVQAEAVCDLIQARCERAAAAAMEQLKGSLSRSLAECYDVIMAVAADLEATLDFAEEELPDTVMSDIQRRLSQGQAGLVTLLETWTEGHVLREGAVVVISGAPNVGKSSLLNRLVGSDRAIVTDMAGTTRDTIEEHVIISGVPVRLVDTAGLRDAHCGIEQEGVERARRQMKEADLNLHMIDASTALTVEDKAFMGRFQADNILIILNKTDLGRKTAENDVQGLDCVSCSLLTGDGVSAIPGAILKRLGMNANTRPHAAISERHRQSIQYGLNELNRGIELLVSGREDHVPLSATHLRACLETLGRITGRTYTDDLLDNIFSRFCVGK